MPEKETRPSSTTTTAPPAQSTSSNNTLADQDLMGNAALQEQLQNSQQSSTPGTFESMWKEISSEGAITDYAVDAVDSALSGMRQWIREQADPDQSATAAQFVRALQGEINRCTRVLMNDYGLSKWIAQHPELIVAGAITSAAAFILNNERIPELKGTMELGGGHSVSGGIDVGRTLEIALNTLSLGYSYTGDAFNAAANYQHDFQSDTWKFSTRLESDLVQMGLVTFADELRAYVRGSYESTGAWEGAAGLEAQQGNLSYGVETFANDDGFASNEGVRATLKFKF